MIEKFLPVGKKFYLEMKFISVNKFGGRAGGGRPCAAGAG
jgi:hypothetical protein